jgi:hypothetical protein
VLCGPGQCYYSSLPNQRTYRFNADAVRAIKSLQNRIRSEAPDDPTLIEALNFNPESDVQQPEAEAKMRELLGDLADYAGLAPDLAYAIRKTRHGKERGPFRRRPTGSLECGF